MKSIGVANWAPTNHSSNITPTLAKLIFQIRTKSKLNLGEYVFDQAMKHAGLFEVKLSVDFPCLITRIIFKLHLEFFHPQETPSKKVGPLTLERKLFVGTHVQDIMVKHHGQMFVYVCHLYPKPLERMYYLS